MENNIVSFIIENIFLFLPVGIAGIIVTIYLYYTGKKDGKIIKDNLEADYITFLKYKINIFVLVYLFIFTIMIVIGILSSFYIPIIVGAIFALIPVILIAGFKNNKEKG